MVYVDDLLFAVEEQEINRIFEQIQQHMLLRPTGESTPGSTVSFLGRQITNRGNYYEITLGDSYIDNILQEAQLETCSPATTPGTTTKETVENEESQRGTTQTVQENGWKATMAFVHTTRHGLRNKGASKGIATANSQTPEETETPH